VSTPASDARLAAIAAALSASLIVDSFSSAANLVPLLPFVQEPTQRSAVMASTVIRLFLIVIKRGIMVVSGYLIRL
jgi:hypothetical protein